MTDLASDHAVAAFITRWQAADGSELANYQLFVLELAALLGVDTPVPAREDTRENAYVFERRVRFAHGDGSESEGRIDCYKRGAFVLEAKKIRAGSAGRAFDAALLAARSQAENYARSLPATEGRPPFVVVVDVGRVIELYSEFTRSGATYVPFPDPRSHRIALADLAHPEIRERLRAVWEEPLSLDPARVSARVTRAIAAQLAEVAKSLEASGNPPKTVAAFLSRCLFTMFAEDVNLLPSRSLVELLERHRSAPDVLARQLESLWANMDRGEFSPLLGTTLLKFNGKLFKDRRALPLTLAQIDGLLAAARADWKQVEPAIFGTLLERALDPEERHALGAHYTRRARTSSAWCCPLSLSRCAKTGRTRRRQRLCLPKKRIPRSWDVHSLRRPLAKGRKTGHSSPPAKSCASSCTNWPARVSWILRAAAATFCT